MSTVGATSEFDHVDVDAAVVFVDMSGFTAFTEVHGDHRAARLAESFASVVTTVLGPGDEMIKTIGDAVLVVCENAASAMTFLRLLNGETGRVPGFPLLRAGVAAGPAVRRRGDVFGSTVNTAARLCAVAQPGQVVVNDAAARALPTADLAAMTGLGPLSLRNLGAPVEAFALEIASPHQRHVDPICRMHVATEAHQLTITLSGVSYRFCSSACMREFALRAGGNVAPRRDAANG